MYPSCHPYRDGTGVRTVFAKNPTLSCMCFGGSVQGKTSLLLLPPLLLSPLLLVVSGGEVADNLTPGGLIFFPSFFLSIFSPPTC